MTSMSSMRKYSTTGGTPLSMTAGTGDGYDTGIGYTPLTYKYCYDMEKIHYCKDLQG